MKKKKKSIKRMMLLLSLLLLIGGVTYAFYEWTSDNTDVAFHVDGLKVIYNGGTNITDSSIIPTSTKEEGVLKTVEIQLDSSQVITPTPTVSLSLELTAFPSFLADSSFKWELYKNDEIEALATGDFSGKIQGDTIHLISNQNVTNNKDIYIYYIYG